MSSKLEQVYIDLSDLRMFIQFGIGMSDRDLARKLRRADGFAAVRQIDVFDILEPLVKEVITGDNSEEDFIKKLMKCGLTLGYAAKVKQHAVNVLRYQLKYFLPHLIFGIEERDSVYVGYDLLNSDDLIVSWSAW